MAKPSKDNFQERIKALAFYGTSSKKVNESSNINATLVEYTRSDDGVAYGIVKENHNYYIKKSNSKGDLNVTDFAFIGGLENKNKYKYGSLSEGQKNLNMVVRSINEAFSLGGVYNRMDESANPPEDPATRPSVDPDANKKPENIMEFISNRIKDGKKNLTESKEKKFKASLQEKVEASTNKKGLMSEEAKTAIQKALGKVNEEALTTKDSEQGDTINDEKDVEKGQSTVLNQDGEKNQKDADKAMAKGKDGIKKADQKGSIAVNEEAMSTKDSEASIDVKSKSADKFGIESSSPKSPTINKDSEITDGDILANKSGKEKPTAPVNDSNAKSKADKGLKTPNAPSTEDSEIDDSDAMANQKDSKEKSQAPVNDTNAKKKADKMMSEGEDLSTADSEVEMAQSLANKKDKKEGAQAPINDTNAKAEAEKRTAGGGGKVTPDETSGDEDIVAMNESEEGDPFKEKSKNEKDMSTDDSEQEDSDRVDNKDKHEKVDSYNSHYDPEMAHKEKKGEKLKPIEQKGAIVAEGDGSLSTADSEIEAGDALAQQEGNMTYDKGKMQKGTSMNADENAIAYEVNEDEIEDAEDDTEAAAQAMDDLEISVDAEEETEETPDVDVDVDAVDGEETPDMGGDAPEGGDTPEGGEEGDVDVDIDVDAEGDEKSDEKEIAYREVKEKIADIAKIIDNHEFEDDKIKDFVNSYLSEFEPEIAGMEVTDRKDMADEILKAKPEEADMDSEVSGLEKGADDAIDAQIQDLEQNGGEKAPEADPAAQAPVQEDEEGCNECGTFEQYAESRGYSIDELHECGGEEMTNLIAGYKNDGGDDARGVAVYIKDPAIIQGLGDYGLADFGEELEPFINSVGEGTPESHVVEPMPSESEDEDAYGLENPEKADLDDDGKLSGYEVERGRAIEKSMDIDEDNEKHPNARLRVALSQAIDSARENKHWELVKSLEAHLSKLYNTGDNKDNTQQQNGGISSVAETMGGGVLKPEGAQIQYEDVVNESEQKIRKYVRNRIAEMTGRKKATISENKKSDKLKALDKMIAEQLKVFKTAVKQEVK